MAKLAETPPKKSVVALWQLCKVILSYDTYLYSRDGDSRLRLRRQSYLKGNFDFFFNLETIFLCFCV